MKKIMIIGNLGQDAKVFEHNEKKVVLFSVGVTYGKGDNKQTDWIECKTTNEALLQYLTKGTKVYVEGMPSVSAYINKENKAVAKMTLYANAIELLGSSKVDAVAETKPKDIKEQLDILQKLQKLLPIIDTIGDKVFDTEHTNTKIYTLRKYLRDRLHLNEDLH